jgi:hypothetical protein
MMNCFGCRDVFAIEVGDRVDHTGQCQLDFYACGIHLNHVDNSANVGIAFHHWPAELFTPDGWAAADIFWEVPFSSSAEILLDKVMIDSGLFQKHSVFSLGPVTDSFNLLAFGRPMDFVLLFIRNEEFTDDESDLPRWSIATKYETTPTHWLSVTIQREEFKHICTGAHACLSALVSSAPQR